MLTFLLLLILLYILYVLITSWKELFALFFLRKFAKKNFRGTDRTIKEEKASPQKKAGDDILNGGEAEYVDFEEINDK